MSEPREGAGKVGWQAADVRGCGGDGGEASGSSSSGSESLEAEPDSSRKLRVFLTAVASSHTSSTELEDRKKIS